jgi:hypothetical protein
VIPPAVRRFLDQRVDDVEQLEIVLLLQRHGDRSWSAADVADALRLGTRRVEQQLEALAGRDLLDVRLGGDVRYRFNDARPAAAARFLRRIPAEEQEARCLKPSICCA